MPSALPLGLLMSSAEEKPLQADWFWSLTVELARKVEPLPLVDQVLPQPALLFLDQEYVGDKPVAVTEKVAVEPAQAVWLAGCAEIEGAALSTVTVTD